ncbi:MAG: EAL domain-containing protein [Spirochaetota bacterium]|nr:EAL domain-containing protein [Spirochaetota bacterium]
MKTPISVLIIDDSKSQSSLLARFLEDLILWDVTHKECTTGNEAITIIKKENIDIIFVDYFLINETGVDVIRSLKDTNCQASIILLTGMSDEQIAINALREGADDYLKKEELSAHVLERSIRHVIEHKRARDELIKSQKSLAEAQLIAHIGNWDWNIETNELYWSDEIYRIFGLTPQEFGATYDAFLNTIHPDDRNLVTNSVNAAINNKIPYSIEHRIVLPNKIERVVHEMGRVYFNDKDKPIRMLGVVQDITERYEAENKIKILAKFPDENPNPILRVSSDCKIIYANRASQVLLKAWNSAVNSQLPDYFHKIINDVIKTKSSKNIEANVENLFFTFLIVPVIDINCVYLYGEDITERKKADDKLHLAAKVFEYSTEAILITNSQGTILEVNHAFCKITGYSHKEIIGKNPNMMKSGKHTNDFYQDMWKNLLEKGKWQGEIWDRRKNGEIYPKWMTINEVKNENGILTHYVAIFSDMTTRKQTEERLQFLAHYDTLTGLPNRILFQDRLKQALIQANHDKKMLSIMFLDLDRFKNINDTMGHFVGDELLKEVANRLKSCVRKTDTISRLGGDEFTIILTDISNIQIVSSISQKIIDIFSTPFKLEGQEIFVTTSIGISMYPADSNNVDNLIKNADTAMYHAKGMGKNNYQFYSAEMNIKAIERLDIEISLRRGLERDEFILYYQPQIDMNDGRIIGAEALLRWNPSKRGLVPPDKFIPLAEETGLIIPISEWVLNTACEQSISLYNKGYHLRMSINLSSLQFKQKDFLNEIKKIIKKTNIDPNYLEFEITESVLIHDVEKTVKTLREFKNMGIKNAIDDFGTGYSSLSYLKRFPIDTLKIDQSFVRDINTNPDASAIVNAIISMGHSLNMKVVAEGVENYEQYKFLRDNFCDIAQGYYLSKPLPADEFFNFLQEKQKLIEVKMK